MDTSFRLLLLLPWTLPFSTIWFELICQSSVNAHIYNGTGIHSSENVTVHFYMAGMENRGYGNPPPVHDNHIIYEYEAAGPYEKVVRYDVLLD
jgi:hypothetical protein